MSRRSRKGPDSRLCEAGAARPRSRGSLLTTPITLNTYVMDNFFWSPYHTTFNNIVSKRPLHERQGKAGVFWVLVMLHKVDIPQVLSWIIAGHTEHTDHRRPLVKARQRFDFYHYCKIPQSDASSIYQRGARLPAWISAVSSRPKIQSHPNTLHSFASSLSIRSRARARSVLACALLYVTCICTLCVNKLAPNLATRHARARHQARHRPCQKGPPRHAKTRG